MCSRVSTMSVAAIVSVPTATIHAWMVPGGVRLLEDQRDRVADGDDDDLRHDMCRR